jgi:hypothetical protein
MMAEDTDKKTEETTNSSKTAIWTTAEDTILVNAMIDQKAAGHWGDNNPKKVTWPEVKKALVGSEKRSGGVAKTISVMVRLGSGRLAH